MSGKRWLLLGLLGGGIACGALIVLALLPPRPGVTKANFDRIQDGMTRAEVETLFGGPPNQFVAMLGYRADVWTSYDCEIRIGFCKNGGVVSRSCGEGWFDDRTVWQKLRALLTGRQDGPAHVCFIPPPYYPLPKEVQSLEEAQRKIDEEAALTNRREKTQNTQR